MAQQCNLFYVINEVGTVHVPSRLDKLVIIAKYFILKTRVFSNMSVFV